MSRLDPILIRRNLEIRLENMLASYEDLVLSQQMLLEIKEKILEECKHMSYANRLVLSKKSIEWLVEQLFMTYSSEEASFMDNHESDMNVLNSSDIKLLKDIFAETALGEALELEHKQRENNGT